MVATSPALDDIELKRRLSGLKYQKLADLTGIRYSRVWRFFTQEDGHLSRPEVARLIAVLEEATAGNASAQNGTPEASQ